MRCQPWRLLNENETIYDYFVLMCFIFPMGKAVFMLTAHSIFVGIANFPARLLKLSVFLPRRDLCHCSLPPNYYHSRWHDKAQGSLNWVQQSASCRIIWEGTETSWIAMIHADFTPRIFRNYELFKAWCDPCQPEAVDIFRKLFQRLGPVKIRNSSEIGLFAFR